MADDEPPASVSSLRSRFEQLATKKTVPASPTTAETPPAPPLRPSHTGSEWQRDQQYPVGSRASLDIPRDRQFGGSGARGGLSVEDAAGFSNGISRGQPQNDRPRPQSFCNSFPTPRGPPAVRVHSPQSSPNQRSQALRDEYSDRRISTPAHPTPAPRPQSYNAGNRAASVSPVHRNGRTPPPPPPPPPVSPRGSRPTSTYGADEVNGNKRSSIIDDPTRRTPLSPALQLLQDHPGSAGGEKQNGPPPPVPMRTAKPVVPSKPSYPVNHGRPETLSGSLAPAASSEEHVSPFSTPPSSVNNSPSRSDAKRGAPEAPPGKQSIHALQYGSPSMHVPAPERLDRALEPVKRPPRSLGPTPPPPPPPPRMSLDGARPPMRIDDPVRGQRLSVDDAKLRPNLPARQIGTGVIGSIRARAAGVRGKSHSPPRVASASEPSNASAFPPPPPRRGQGPIKSRTFGIPGTGGLRNISGVSNASTVTTATTASDSNTAYANGRYDSDEEDEQEMYDERIRASDYPDASQANRRMPFFSQGPRRISCKSDVRLFAVSGQYVCTTGHTTRVWDVETGGCIMDLPHKEGMRITAVAFKPDAHIPSEGSVLWLGTSHGELLEVDIASQRIVENRQSAHMKKEIVKIHRRGFELWTIDASGKLQLWASDDMSGPNLRNSPYTFRINERHTCSIVIDGLLWVGHGKTVCVYQPSTDQKVVFDVVRNMQPSKPTGSITCCAIVNSEPDKVYFGHSDGKVSVFSRSKIAPLEVVNVSTYMIKSMTGVGDYLWAGFRTGKIYVYDVRSTPWRVLKDWQSHDGPITEIYTDRTSIWKNGRLQVLSLGEDNAVGIWDGMLEEDWLEDDMQKHDVEYCTFREIKAIVCTWNAGASKPQDLLTREEDSKFLARVIGSEESPDIIVFGFQELVDLEDKKITAKSFLKGGNSKKKKEADRQEHISRQYKLWTQQLQKTIDAYMPRDESYSLLETAAMVGLFTCIFVKTSQRKYIRNTTIAREKRGFKGTVGNKGGVVIRFYMDDSSLCFINCHLAAGQGNTVSRNNDVAGILEDTKLIPEEAENERSNLFVGGGDGSKILDNEICILNGDLNYRIDMQRDSVISKVKRNDIASLLERDQLLKERKNNPGFRLRVFNELPLTFFPTYKYDVGTDDYDTSEKKRAPAWCDRLLYRSMGRIKQTEYRRWEVKASDHRPVSGMFFIRLKKVDLVKKRRCWEQSAARYNKVRARHVWEAQMDYLMNVMGLSDAEARKRLGDRDTIVDSIMSSTPPIPNHY